MAQLTRPSTVLMQQEPRDARARDLDSFVQDATLLIGQPAADVPPGAPDADWLTIRRFCAALGDQNPLYKDPAGAAATKYNTMIAPNSFVFAVRTPNSTGPYSQRDYGLAPFFRGASAEWWDVIRLGDRLDSSLRIVDVRSARWPSDDRVAADVISEALYRNSYGGRIGVATGTVALCPYERGTDLFLERDIYRYSAAEVKRIETDIAAESPPRGKSPRYWDEVEVGDRVPQLVKGPVTLADMMAWVIAEAKEIGLGPVVHRELLEQYPGRQRTNPSTKWPYWDADQEFEDILSCRDLGFKMPVTRGQQRFCLAGQLCTDWMGDEAFLRRVEVDLPLHWVYGDTMWLNAEVVQKRTEERGAYEYKAVDLRLVGTNQLEETILRGSATVYLPNPGMPVQLPIPH